MSNGNPGSGFLSAYAPWQDIARKKGSVHPLFFLTLPINILSLGLFTFVLNALLFWSVTWFVPGFTVDSFVSAFVASFLVSLMSLIFSWFLIF